MMNLKAICGILLIFVLGAACGFFVSQMIYQSRMESYMRGDPKAREEMLVKRLSRRLDLDDRQLREVRAIVEKTHGEMREIRRQIRPQMDAVLEKSRAEMRKLLRPDQLRKYEEFVATHKARRAKGGW